jgi:hypothetical protein
MKSKWFESKNKATSLRKKGLSIRYIENKLGIPRSTLSGWFKDVKLSKRQKDKLHKKWVDALIKARKKAVLVHNKGRRDRRESIRQEVEKFTSGMEVDKKTGELLMAIFYLAEGGKTENSFNIANSNPKILKGVINLQRYLYKLDESKFSCCLHLRKDQDENILKEFWSKTLNIPKCKFTKTQFDKRTIKKTYDHYKGVCTVNYFDMALQRRILYLGEKLLEIINKNMGA